MMEYLRDAKTPGVRTTPGGGWVDYMGGELEVIGEFNWVMQGGQPLTYGEVFDVVDHLSEWFEIKQPLGLDYHPFTAEISVGSDTKITCSLHMDPKMGIAISNHPLEFDGFFYPQRAVPSFGIVNQLFEQAAQDIRQIINLDPQAEVEEKFDKTFKVDGTVLRYSDQHLGVIPRVRWYKVLDIMKKLQRDYQRRDVLGSFSGTLSKGGKDDFATLQLNPDSHDTGPTLKVEGLIGQDHIS